jgi:hypothetical protein
MALTQIRRAIEWATGVKSPPQPKTITEKQALDLDAEIDELHVDRHRLLAFAGVDRIADIPAAMWPKIREKMDAKRASLKNGGAR